LQKRLAPAARSYVYLSSNELNLNFETSA
jgi:hypothetical protein